MLYFCTGRSADGRYAILRGNDNDEVNMVKHDDGKPRAALVLGDFAEALMDVVEVGTFGARKYSPHGWIEVPDAIERYRDALWRHLLADAAGDPIDDESGLLHLAHAAWNILAVLELSRPGHAAGGEWTLACLRAP